MEAQIAKRPNLLSELEKAEKIYSKIQQLNDVIEETQIKIEDLKSEPNYRTPNDIEKMKKELKETEKIISAVRNVETKPDEVNKGQCAICYQDPDTVFGCQICDNWICGGCLSKLKVCPHCREDLGKVPMTRNKTLERFLRK